MCKHQNGPRPPVVVFWETYQGRCPKLCWTCRKYARPMGMCVFFGCKVPYDASIQEDRCPNWEQYDLTDIPEPFASDGDIPF